MELTKEMEEALQLMAEKGITPEQVLTLEETRTQLEEQTQEIQEQRDAITAQQAELAKAEHEAQVDAVMLALEGKHEVDGVTAVEGYRHYPAVVEAVGKALRGIPAGLTLQLSRDGKDEQVSAVAVILDVVNALPEKARLSIENLDIEDHARNIDGPEDVTPEMIQNLAAMCGLEIVESA